MLHKLQCDIYIVPKFKIDIIALKKLDLTKCVPVSLRIPAAPDA